MSRFTSVPDNFGGDDDDDEPSEAPGGMDMGGMGGMMGGMGGMMGGMPGMMGGMPGMLGGMDGMGGMGLPGMDGVGGTGMPGAPDEPEATEARPHDVNGDGSVLKVILARAPDDEFYRPDEHAECEVHYDGTLLDGGSTFASSGRAAGGAPFAFRMRDVGATMPAGFVDGLRTMRRGETARLTVQPARGYGGGGRADAPAVPPNVPPNATLVYVVELLRVVAWVDVLEGAADGAEAAADGGAVLKRVVAAGEGWEHPKANCDVEYSFRPAAADAAAAPFAAVERATALGADRARLRPAGLRSALHSMKRGEEALVRLALAGGGEARYALTCHGWVENEDPHGDGSVVKRRLRAGAGWRTPGELARCRLYVRLVARVGPAASAERVTVVDSFPAGWEWAPRADDAARDDGCAARSDDGARGASAAAFAGTEHTVDDAPAPPLCAGLEAVLKLMKKNELAEATIAPGAWAFDDAAAAALGDARLSGAPLEARVFVDDFEEPPNAWDLDAAAKLVEADAIRARGNALFQRGDYARAVRRYAKALSYVGADHDLTDEQKRAQRERRASIHLNRAACYLKLGDYAAAVRDCDRVLEGDATNVKALYRKGHALTMTDEWDAAKVGRRARGRENAYTRAMLTDLRARARAAPFRLAKRCLDGVLRVDPENAAAKKMQQQLKARISKQARLSLSLSCAP